MKKQLSKIISIFMALMVLSSTLSFAIEKHFCGNILVDTTIFSELKKCGMESQSAATQKSEVTKKHCCKDTVDIIKGQDELKVSSFDDLGFQQQHFLTAFTYSFLIFYEGLPKKVVPHEYYSPPNLVLDIQVLDQVFLI